MGRASSRGKARCARTISMPELPEVETTVRGLVPVLEGRRLTRVETRREDLRWPFPPNLRQRLTGAEVTALGRRAKYGLIGTDRGDTLVFHLGMSGRWRIDPSTRDAHDHFLLETDDGHAFKRRFAGRRGPVKPLLLDQRTIAGLGNIYACEALHRAGIHPARAGGSISVQRLDRLAAAIPQVLGEAVAAGGSSLRDFVGPDGTLGYFSKSFAVYGREGAACACGGTVKRLVQGGRSTFYCPRC